MAEHIDLSRLERRIWARNFQDGLWDIFLGMILLASGVGTLLGEMGVYTAERLAVTLGIIVLGAAGLWLSKHLITRPRMGRVNFGQARVVRSQRASRLYVLMALLNSGLLITARLANPTTADLADTWYPIAYALMMLIFLGAGAYLLDFERLYIHAFLFAMPWPLREMAPTGLRFLPFAVFGVVAIGMGVVVLIGFLRRNPIRRAGSAEQE